MKFIVLYNKDVSLEKEMEQILISPCVFLPYPWFAYISAR